MVDAVTEVLDKKEQARLAQEAERNAQIQKQQEERLKQEQIQGKRNGLRDHLLEIGFEGNKTDDGSDSISAAFSMSATFGTQQVEIDINDYFSPEGEMDQSKWDETLATISQLKQEAEQAQQQADREVARQARLDAKPKGIIPLSVSITEDVNAALVDMDAELSQAEQHALANRPKNSKKVSTVIASAINATLHDVLIKALTPEKAELIDIDKLREAKAEFIAALMLIRGALGGTLEENQAMLQRFDQEYEATLSKIASVQQSLQNAA